MARIVVNHTRDLFDRWFRLNVSDQVPDQETVQKARQQMLDAQRNYEKLLILRTQYQAGLHCMQECKETKSKV